jgi:hypothetical protein
MAIYLLSRRLVHQQPPQLQGSVIRWELLLPQRCLNIPSVENGHLTRQLDDALLRIALMKV